MYNRYIPQSDGSFQRSRLPEQIPASPQPTRNPAPAAQNPPPATPPPPVFTPQPRAQFRQRPTRSPHPSVDSHRDSSVLSFLRQLLPKDFDTSDLMIVLLLLLMSNDCTEDQNWALLTLALYLFM